MTKVTSLAAALLVSTLIVAPAGAADLHVSSPSDPIVRISVAGKSAAQLNTEIKAAAESVCDGMPSGCVNEAIVDAEDQLSAITATHRTAASSNLQIMREGPTTIHVSLKGKSIEQINSDIEIAAHTVCKDSNPSALDYSACVDTSISDAKYQLRSVVAQGDLPG